MNASNIYKAEKGLIRVNAEIEDNKIKKIEITGDFFIVPENKLQVLETKLTGKKLERQELEKVLDEFYALGVITPLLTKDDFINAVMGVK